jgi:hypothetical protein
MRQHLLQQAFELVEFVWLLLQLPIELHLPLFSSWLILQLLPIKPYFNNLSLHRQVIIPFSFLLLLSPTPVFVEPQPIQSFFQIFLLILCSICVNAIYLVGIQFLH